VNARGVVAPQNVKELAQSLEDAGYETWCVGGAVRDALLGMSHLDWDLATAAPPQQVIDLFGRRRTVPVGIKHGTVGVRDRNGLLHEVTTFRRDVRTDGRHAEVEFGVSLEDDLARRDFTMNAIAYHPITGELRDPFGGRADIDAKLVRAVGDPDSRMKEDRLRALRALRFTSRFGFRMDPATWKAVMASAPYLDRLSAERVQQELVKTMDQVRYPSSAMRLWRESGALSSLIPSIAGIGDEVLASLDCTGWPDATLREELKSARRLLRLAVLFSGAGEAGAAKVMKGLRFSSEHVNWVSTLIRKSDELGGRVRDAWRRQLEDAAVRRLVAEAGRTRVLGVIRLVAARSQSVPAARLANLYRRASRIAYTQPVELSDLAVDGDDLREAGLPPGPALGQILRGLLDAVIEDPSRNTRAELLDRARKLAAN
jgi:tRNA nucleotidyltransferase (CCA-adding enzyme)